MEGELEQFHKRNSHMELNITDLKLKLKTGEKEVNKGMQRVRALLE